MIDAPVVSRSTLGNATLLTVALPAGIDPQGAAGRFFLARCAPGEEETRPWDPYLRQPLFPVRVDLRGEATLWSLLLPPLRSPADPPLPHPLHAEPAAAAFLHALRPGDTLNLLGPYGSGFSAEPRTRALLLVADLLRAPLLLPLLDAVLDRGGRVTLLLDAGEESATQAAALLPLLPLAVEARVEAHGDFSAALASLTPWADRICMALPFGALAGVAAVLRSARLKVTPDLAQALVEAPLPCGVGACLACVVPLAGGGHTRACAHGPVMELTRLV